MKLIIILVSFLLFGLVGCSSAPKKEQKLSAIKFSDSTGKTGQPYAGYAHIIGGQIFLSSPNHLEDKKKYSEKTAKYSQEEHIRKCREGLVDGGNRPMTRARQMDLELSGLPTACQI